MTRKFLAVTGATGFIGSHLVPRLLSEGHEVKALSRRPLEYRKSGVDVRRADLLEYSLLEPALEGVQTAFYLIRSMRMGSDYADLDRIAAINFLHAAENAGVERIIYLGGLGEIGENLSAHLKSRAEVGRILQSGEVPATVLRAAIIIGPGGGS